MSAGVAMGPTALDHRKRHTFATNTFPMCANFGDMLAVGGGPGCPV